VWKRVRRTFSNQQLGMRVYMKLKIIISVKSMMFLHCKIHKFTWTSPDGKAHSQIDHILIDRRQHPNVLHVQSFRAADCDTDHCVVVVAEIREKLAVSKQGMLRFNMEKLNLIILNEVDGKEQYCVEILNRSAALENLDTEVDVSSALEPIREIITITAEESLHYYDLCLQRLLRIIR
jgi:hypothetical protein